MAREGGGGSMTEREVVETLLDNGFTILTYKRFADTKTQLSVHNGVTVTCYDNGDYLVQGVQGKSSLAMKDVVAVLKREVVKKKETDTTGGIIGVGI